MNVDIRDADAARALQPLDVVAYLRAADWAQAGPPTPAASVWVKGDGADQFEAVVPLDRSVRDYPLRIGELLHTLARAERRSQAEVYADLLTATADVVRVRIDDPDLADGSLPIEANARVAQKTRDLMLAAACAAHERRAVWPNRKPAEAVEQVRRLRIGPSGRGSYVLTVVALVGPALRGPKNQTPFGPTTPPERLLTRTLAEALQALADAAAASAISGEFAAFGDAIPRGVSANLCDAVAGIWGDDDRERALEFTFAWSPARPNEGAVPSRVRIGRDRIPVIREAARVMRERGPADEFELAGDVVQLDRPHRGPLGRATVRGRLDGRPQRVVVELGGDDYTRAVIAHAEDRPVRCVGKLVRDGRKYVLRAVRDFAVDAD